MVRILSLIETCYCDRRWFKENSTHCPGIVCNLSRFQTLTRRGQKGLSTRPTVGLVSNMSRSPRASYADVQGVESKKSSRPDPKVVQASSPQLFRCPRCSTLSFRVLFRDRDVAGICTECNLQLRTDRRIGRATREYYAEFNRQVGAGDSERIERIFLKMISVSEAKRVYPVVRRLGYRTKQSSPMLHARLVMVETTRDRALVLIEKLREGAL